MYDASLFEATVQILQQSVQYLKELSERMRVSFNAHLDVRVLVIMRSPLIMYDVQSDLGFRQAIPEQCHVLVSSDQRYCCAAQCRRHQLLWPKTLVMLLQIVTLLVFLVPNTI